MRSDDQRQLRSGVGESTVRSSVVLVVVAVFVSLTAGAVAGAAVGTTGGAGAPGTGAGTVASASVAGSAGAPTLGHRIGVQYRQAGDGDGQSGDSSVSICERDAQRFVNVYNSQTDSVPGLVSNRVEDSNVHLQVDNDADRNYTMVTDEEGRVTEYSVGKPESASLRVETDCATFQEITDSERPTETFRVAYAEDRIRFIGLGTVNSLFFAGLDRLTDPIAWGVLLVLFILVVVVLYLFYRRLTLYYRDDDEDEDGPDEGGGSHPGDGAAGGGPPDPNTRSGHPPGQNQGQGQGQGQRRGQGQTPGEGRPPPNQGPPGRGRGTGDGPEPRPDDRSDSRSSDPRPGDRRG